MFSDRLIKWLSREQPDKSNGNTIRKAFALSTDVGLLREQNQDRVAYIRVSGSPSGNKPFLAVALSDGMGGMKNGAECAVRTISYFFDSLLRNRNVDDALRVSLAVKDANDSVYTYAGGYGGATLSAFFISEDGAIIVNVGDSRIYADSGGHLKRLTRDDSMAEMVGGSGRELLQFIGMGDSLKVRCAPIYDEYARVILTSDGVHFVSQETLGMILAKAPDLAVAVNRVNTLVRWSGAPDNATLAILSVAELQRTLKKDCDVAVEFADPFGDFYFGWGREDVQSPSNNKIVRNRDIQEESKETSNENSESKYLEKASAHSERQDKNQDIPQASAHGEGSAPKKSIEDIKKEIARIQGDADFLKRRTYIDPSSQDLQEPESSKDKAALVGKRITRVRKRPQGKNKKNGEGLQIVIEMDSNHREDSDEGSDKV